MGNIFKSICQLLISILLSIFIVIPIFSIIFGFNEIRRLFVKIYFKVTKNPSELSTGSDGAYAYSSRAVVRILCACENNFKFDKFKELFIKNILEVKDSHGKFLHKKLRSNFITKAGYSCWTPDKNFDLNNHFRILPEDLIKTEEELMEFIHDLGEPLAQDRPQWEFIFIPTLPSNTDSSSCGFLIRMHHSYGDGFSIMNTLGEQLSPENPFPYVINPVTFEPNFWLNIFFIIKGYSYFSWTLFQGILKPPKVASEDRHRSEEMLNNSRFNLNLAQLKNIQRKGNGCTISAIILTAAQNALDQINENTRLWLNSCIIVARVPYPKNKFCNRITQINAVVPVLKNHAFHQLQEVNKKTKVRDNLTCFVNGTMGPLLGRMPAKIVQKIKFQNWMLISNLPFTTRPFRLGDGLMTDCFVWSAVPKSIMISSLSVGDKMNVSIGAGGNILSKAELSLFVEEMKNQLNLMELSDDVQKKVKNLSWV